MKDEDIAREHGLLDLDELDPRNMDKQGREAMRAWKKQRVSLLAALAAARADERERCAKVCDIFAQIAEAGGGEINWGDRMRQAARDIRALEGKNAAE